MNKIVYMVREEFAPFWVKKYFPKDYPIEFFDPDKTYPTDVVFLHDMYGFRWTDLIPEQLARGHRVIYDAKNEHFVHHNQQWVLDEFIKHPGQGMFLISGDAAADIPGVTIQATPYWYWIVDQGAYSEFRIDRIKSNADYQYKFLLTLNRIRVERDYLYERLTPLLPQSLYSYREREQYISNDTNNQRWQRYLNPEWIKSCCFTLAVETYISNISTTGYSLTTDNHLFLSEKTYKPLSAQHPFILVGTAGNLAYVRKQGFETFPELFDESYDDIPDWQQRIDRIVEIIRDVDIRSFDNSTVKEKLEHNQNRIFDSVLVAQLCNDTVVEPIINFANR